MYVISTWIETSMESHTLPHGTPPPRAGSDPPAKQHWLARLPVLRLTLPQWSKKSRGYMLRGVFCPVQFYVSAVFFFLRMLLICWSSRLSLASLLFFGSFLRSFLRPPLIFTPNWNAALENNTEMINAWPNRRNVERWESTWVWLP